MGNKANATAKAAETQEKRRQSLELRKQGLTYEAIGRGLDCSTSRAHELVTEGLEQIPREAAKDVMALELSRLDAMMDGAWPKAAAGDTRAAALVVRIMERRAAYLGLDAPKRTEIWGSGEPFDVSKALG